MNVYDSLININIIHVRPEHLCENQISTIGPYTDGRHLHEQNRKQQQQQQKGKTIGQSVSEVRVVEEPT